MLGISPLVLNPRLCHAVGERYRDDRGGYCNTKALESCLIAYFCWFKKVKGHVKIEETSFSHNELAVVTLEVSALSSEACL